MATVLASLLLPVALLPVLSAETKDDDMG